MPAICTPARPGTAAPSHRPIEADEEGTMVGSIIAGTPNVSSSLASHCSECTFMRSVREALDTSVTCAVRPVKFQMSHVSTVPKRAVPASAASRRPGTFSSSHTSLVAEKYGTIGRPVCARKWSFPLRKRAATARAISSVRVSFHTMALCSGMPVVLSHTMVVSRWLVMPIALSSPGRIAPPSALSITSRVLSQISSGSCSTQPALG
mmetsp:Transcript_19270/g.60042  ORF Transcript_19270/g.60042 Transcript_19270/m.60042 type:complete len:207 (+) Transcript_19270:981-1601(+)